MQRCPHDVIHLIMGWTQEIDASSCSETKLRAQILSLREEHRRQQLEVVRVCTRVCHSLADVARPMLFYAVTIYYRKNARQRCSALLELIANEPRISQWIRRLTITSGSVQAPPKQVHENFEPEISTALFQKLVEARTLVFDLIYLHQLEDKQDVLNIFRSLQSITSLHFCFVRFSSIDCANAVIRTCGSISHLFLEGVESDNAPSMSLSPSMYGMQSIQNLDLSKLPSPGWSVVALATGILSFTQPLRLRIQTNMFKNEPRYKDILTPLNKILPRLTALSLVASNDCGGLDFSIMPELRILELNNILHCDWATSILCRLTDLPKFEQLYLTFPHLGYVNALDNFLETRHLDATLCHLCTKVSRPINLEIRAERASWAQEISKLTTIFTAKLPRTFKSSAFVVTCIKLRSLEIASENPSFWSIRKIE
jgi:hypothetical protein